MFNKILVPVDLTEPRFADKAVAAAVEEARHHKADLHFMTVLPGFGMPMVASFFPPDAMQKAAQEVKKELQGYVAKKVPKDLSVTLVVAEGTPYEEILAEAKKVKADLIMLHSHMRTHVDNILIGSCAQKVVEHAHCSVTVLRD
jgi:nucleotide-binding universal stress UspA family protein